MEASRQKRQERQPTKSIHAVNRFGSSVLEERKEMKVRAPANPLFVNYPTPLPLKPERATVPDLVPSHSILRQQR